MFILLPLALAVATFIVCFNPSISAYAATNSFSISCLIDGSTSTITGDFHEAETIYGRDSALENQNYIRYSVVINGSYSVITWAKADSPEGPFDFENSAIKGYSYELTDVLQSGYYKARVTFENEEYIDSDVTLHAIINPREVSVNWNTVSFVYNGTPRIPTASAKDSLMKDKGDDGNEYDHIVPLSLSGEAINACPVNEPYIATAESTDPNYTIKPSSYQRSFIITKASVSVDWSQDKVDGIIVLTYTSDPISPTANATTLSADGSKQISIITTKYTDVNPTEIDYVSTASIDPDADPTIYLNYSLSNATQTFRISPKTIDLTWDGYEKDKIIELTYNGTRQFPVPIALFKDNNYAIIADDINYGGADVGTYRAKAIPSSNNFVFADAYETSELNVISFSIIPLPRLITWYDATDSNNKVLATIDNNGYIAIDLTYNNTDQIQNIVAALLDLNDNELTLLVRSVDNSVFRNAGEYELTAVTSAYDSSSNYTVDVNSITKIKAIIKKANAQISVGTSVSFIYDGLSKSIDVQNTGDGELKFRINDSEVSNSFLYPGIYNVEIFSLESVNFFASPTVHTTITINATELSTSDNDIAAIIELPEGISPVATIKISDKTASKDTAYSSTIVRSIDKLYKIDLFDEYSQIDFTTPVKVKVQLNGYNNDDTIRIVTLDGDKLIEQTVTMKDGYFTFTLYEDGYFALTSIDADSLFLWWVIVIGAIALVGIVLLIAWHKKHVRTAPF